MPKKSVVPFSFDGIAVRTVMVNGEPWWVAKDVCDVLGILNPSDAISKNLDDDEKGVDLIYTPGGKQKVVIVNESGLYSLILRSRKPEAKRFKRWVTHEVLPTIRKTGSYTMTREKSKEYRKTFTAALQMAGYTQPREYQHTTAEMKLSMGLGWKPKDEMTEDELSLVMAAEALSTLRIKNERLQGFAPAHSACVDTSIKARGLIGA